MIAEADFDLPDVLPDGFRFRPYQVECVRRVESGWQKYSRQLISMATGAGKTPVAAAIIHGFVRAGGKVLFLAHTEELLDQAADKFSRAAGLAPDKEKAEFRASLSSSVVIASVQTLARQDRLTGFPENHFALVVVDECHRSMSPSYQRILCYFHFGAASLIEGWTLPRPTDPHPFHAKLLGVSATLDRGDKRCLGEFWQSVAFEYNLKQAVRDGWLVRPIVRQIPVKIDLSGVKIKRGDFDINEAMSKMEPFIEEMCALLVREVGPRKTVIFVPSVHLARRAAEIITRLGVAANFVSGACEERAQKIENFRQNRFQVMANALILTEGWDDDSVSCVSIWRPTKIRSFYVQCVGRASRTLAGLVDACVTREERLAAIAASAKPDFIVLDPLWLSERMDLVKPADLVATRAEVREKMLRDSNPDLVQSEAEASVELLASLAREAGKHSNKKARTIDPLNFASKIKDEAVANYAPAEGWEYLPPTDEQLSQLKKWGFETERVITRGLATKLIDRKIARDKLGLCTPAQLEFLERIGYQNPQNFTKDRATEILVGHRKRWAEKKQRATTQ